jgi:uncharacterized protein YjbI with pentapeptide repeats
VANEEHVEILRKGGKAWNCWFHQDKTMGAYMRQFDFSGADLRGLDLSEAHFNHSANFREADLRDTKFYSAHAPEADFTGARFEVTTFYKANLQSANLSDVDLSHCDLSNAVLTNAKLQRAKLRHAFLYESMFIGADLSDADLANASAWKTEFRDATLRNAKLIETDLGEADLIRADLSGADLTGANLSSVGMHDRSRPHAPEIFPGAELVLANLTGASLVNANLNGSNLGGANLSGADLRDADLSGAILVNADLRSAKLNGCRVFGASVWNVQTDQTEQSGLIITRPGQPIITVDSLKVAQFIYLLLDNRELREVIDTIGRKAVLILGRFTPKRKVALDAIRDELRSRNYLPIMFDFQKPGSRTYRETVSTLAHMARFVIADITDAKVILQELEVIVPTLSSVPVQPILQSRARQVSVLSSDYNPYPWVLPVAYYRNPRHLVETIAENIIEPAESRVRDVSR